MAGQGQSWIAAVDEPCPSGLDAFASALAFFERNRPLAAAALVLFSWLAIHGLLSVLGPTVFFDGGWVVYWPVNAITVAVMLMVPRWCWPWMQIGSLLDQAQANAAQPPLLMATDAFSNTLEVFITAYALPPFLNLTDWMQRPKLFSRFIVYALLVAPGITSIPMALYYHHAHVHGFWEATFRWILADALGMCLWLPLVLALRSRETYAIFRLDSLALTLSLLGLVCASSWLVFHQSVYPIAFVVMPALLLVVFRLGFSGSTLASILISIIVSHASLHGSGPFQLIPGGWDKYRVCLVQIYLNLCVLFSLPVSVVLLQRRIFERELGEAYQRMETAATIDGLTGVANRRRFDTMVEQEWRRAMREHTPLALLMVDVDFFKPYNDSFGHLAGDECLRRIAAGLAAIIKRGSDLVARYGGEEFAILLPGANQAAAARLARRIVEEIALLGIEHGCSSYGRVTVSVGGHVLQPSPLLSTHDLVDSADRALYAAKQGGRNRVAFFSADAVAADLKVDPELPAVLLS